MTFGTQRSNPGWGPAPRKIYTAYRTISDLEATWRDAGSTATADRLRDAMDTLMNVAIVRAKDCTEGPEEFCWCNAWEAMTEIKVNR